MLFSTLHSYNIRVFQYPQIFYQHRYQLIMNHDVQEQLFHGLLNFASNYLRVHNYLHGDISHSIFYVIEGGFSQCRTDLEKRIAYSAIASMQMFKGFSVYRTFSLAETAEWIMSLADKIERNFGKGIIPYYLTQHYLRGINTKKEEQEEGLPQNVFTFDSQSVSEKDYCNVVKKTKKDNITENNISEIMLCQIPGISSVTAIAIMKHFSNISDLIYKLHEDPNCLQHIQIETNGKSRKLNKNIIESIHRFLIKKEEVST